MTGIVPVAGGRITGVVLNPDTGGTITPESGIGFAAPLTCGSSLRGCDIVLPSLPRGKVGVSGPGRTTSGKV